MVMPCFSGSEIFEALSIAIFFVLIWQAKLET